MSLGFWNNLRLFQNNKPLIMFLNHFSNSSFFLGLYQVLLKSSLFKICLVGDVYLTGLKWCVVICPKSQVMSVDPKFFCKNVTEPSWLSAGGGLSGSSARVSSGLLSGTDLLDWPRGPCGCPSRSLSLTPLAKRGDFIAVSWEGGVLCCLFARDHRR